MSKASPQICSTMSSTPSLPKTSTKCSDRLVGSSLARYSNKATEIILTLLFISRRFPTLQVTKRSMKNFKTTTPSSLKKERRKWWLMKIVRKPTRLVNHRKSISWSVWWSNLWSTPRESLKIHKNRFNNLLPALTMAALCSINKATYQHKQADLWIKRLELFHLGWDLFQLLYRLLVQFLRVLPVLWRIWISRLNSSSLRLNLLVFWIVSARKPPFCSNKLEI